jgi:hypothetical protein
MRWCISCLAFNLLATNSAVVAVIDFGDVNWGDGDYDFHYLLSTSANRLRWRSRAATDIQMPINS